MRKEKKKTGRTHFMAMVGTSLYEPVFYWDTEEQKAQAIEDEYVQMAVIRKYIDELEEEGKITLFVTDFAKARNLDDRVLTEGDEKTTERWASKRKEAIKSGEVKKGLATQLKEAYPELTDRINIVSIPDGKTEAEIWEIFDKIYQEIETDDQIVFDVTHSYRSLSIIAVIVLNYARTMKDCRLKGFHYGLFEGAEVDHENGRKYVMLVDMYPMIEILLWNDAANSFIRYGNASEILELQRESNQRLTREQKIMPEWNQLGRMVEAVSILGEGISCCRGSDATDGEVNEENAKRSIKMAYRYLNECSTEEAKEKAKTSKPMFELLNKAGKSFERFDRERNYQIGLAVVEWSIENNMIQQGYTALEETIKTYLCYRYGLDDSMKETRDNIIGTSVNALDKAQANLHDQKELLSDREVVKEYIWNNDREFLRMDCDEQTKELFDRILLDCSFEIVKIASAVKNNRNDLNHFGFNKQPISSEKLRKNLATNYNKFIQYIAANGDM